MTKKLINPCETCKRYNESINDAMINPLHYMGHSIKKIYELLTDMKNEPTDENLGCIVYPDICESCTTGDHGSISIYNKDGLENMTAIAEAGTMLVESIEHYVDDQGMLFEKDHAGRENADRRLH